MTIDLDLVRKYNVPGPRYTSYPPATRFSDGSDGLDGTGREALEAEIVANNRACRALSLYFHIPFCQSLCWYCGCTTVITTDHRKSAAYVDYLEREVERMAARLNPERRVVQIHFGGGTPTFLSPLEIRALGNVIRRCFTRADDVEAGVEIDPRHLTDEHVSALRDAGFNRASIGVQDFDPRVQQAVHRIQPLDLTRRALDALREAGFESVNFDLIYGLPHQTARSFEQTLDAVRRLGPDRLAVYSYAHVPWMKPAQKILEEALPTPEEKLELLKMTVEKLTTGGEYVYIGMDHFARPDDELALARRNKTLQRNFQGYSTRGDADIYSFGISSISRTENMYWQNEKVLERYRAAIDEGRHPAVRMCVLGADDKIRRETIMRLMCDLSLDFQEMSGRLGVCFGDYFNEALSLLEPLERDGLVRLGGGRLDVTEMGRLFIRNIAMCFDAYLPRQTERRFSRTV